MLCIHLYPKAPHHHPHQNSARKAASASTSPGPRELESEVGEFLYFISEDFCQMEAETEHKSERNNIYEINKYRYHTDTMS